MDRFKVISVEMFDVVDTETPAPGDEPDHPEGRIMFNTRSKEEAERYASELNSSLREDAG